MTNELQFRVVRSNTHDETLVRCTNLPIAQAAYRAAAHMYRRTGLPAPAQPWRSNYMGGAVGEILAAVGNIKDGEWLLPCSVRVRLYPEDLIELRQGARVIEKGKPPAAAAWPTRHRSKFSRTALRTRPSVPLCSCLA
jgi:hypothetical protein